MAKAPKASKAKEAKSKGGRPTDYSPKYVEQVKALCEQGFTDQEIADFYGIHVSTLYRWKGLYPEFCEAIKIGGAPCDDRVERSLYHRAIGYSFKSEKVFQFQGVIVRANIVEHCPPDTTSATFWLKNRRKEQWRDRSELDQTVKGETPAHQTLDEIQRKLSCISAVLRKNGDAVKPDGEGA